MSEKCGNLYAYNEPLTTDHAIILPGIDDCSYSRYLEVINSVIGSKHIHSIFESNGQIKIYFKDKKYVTEILESGILLNKNYSRVSPLDFVLLKIYLSRVDPAIPDNSIEDVLKTYGHLESPIVHTKVSEKSDFDHIDCGIREVKLKVYDGIRFPTKLNLFYKGIFYEVDAKVIDQTPLKRSSDVMKTKKKDKYGKCKSTNVIKKDSSLTCESFPEWCKNNPDNCGGNKSQNSIDLLLQIHQSQTYLPKKNYQFYDKENSTALLFEKKTKLPVIQEQQIVAFSKNCVPNCSFDNTAKTAEIVLEKRHLRSNGAILQNRISSQSKQICSDKTHVNLSCEKIKKLDSTEKRHIKLKKIPKDIASGRNNRTKPVKTFPNIEKDAATKVHNTRGTLKKIFSEKSSISGKTVCPPNHSAKKSKRLIEKYDLGHNEINLPLTSSSSPNLSGEKKTLSEKLGVCDNDICPSSKNRSAKKKISSEKAGVCDKNIYPLSNSSSLLNHKTVKKKTPLKKSCTYNDLLCSSSNSSLPKHRAVKEETSVKSSVSNSSNNKSTPSNTSSLPKQKFGKGRTSEESDNLNNAVCPPSNASSSPKCRAFKVRAPKESVVHNDECPSSKSSSPKLVAAKIVFSEESSVCNDDVCQPSNSSSLPKSRAVKRKTSSEESGAYNSSSPKSPSSSNLAVKKRKKLKEKAIVCDNDAHLSSESISSANNIAAQCVVQDSSLNDSNQNVVDVHHPINQSAIPIDNLLSEVVQSDFSHNPVLGPISNTTDTSPPNIKNQHPTTETFDDVSSNSTQLEDNTENVEENFNISDQDVQSTETQINNKLNKLATCDLNVENTSLPSSITAQSSVQIPIFSSNNLNADDSSLLKIPNHDSDGNLEEKVASNVKDLTQNLIQDVIDLNSSKTEKNDDLTKILADEAMDISACEEKKETLEEISITSHHISPSLSSSLTLKAHSNKKDLDFSHCNPEELDSSERQSQNTVPINNSQYLCEDNLSSHLIADAISVKTASDIPFSKSNCEEPTLESDLSNGEYVNKDENNKNDISIGNDDIMNSCSKLALSANQERTSLHNLPNVMYNKFNSNETDAHQYVKQQVVSRKCLKSKLSSSLTVNPASFLMKSTAKNKSKNYGRYPANKMVHRLQHKNSLNHQTKKCREYQNRQYLFSSTQDKNLYEYEFDSDEDYSDQVSYSKWKNQNCSSKEYKKLDTNFTRRLTHSFNSYLQNKKRRNGINDVVMDENSELGTFNNKIGSISELRKRFKEAISPASSKLASINKEFDPNNYLPKNNVQTAGESSTKRNRVDSSENFYSSDDYFEVVHLGDGKHEKLSIIVKKKSKLDAPNKRDSVNVNSDLQTLKMISKDSPSEFKSDPHNSSSKCMNTIDQQSIKKCQKRITSNDLIQNSSPVLHSEIFNVSSHNISYKTVPKYRVKSNTFGREKVISSPKTSKEDEFITNCKHQDNSLVPESSTLNKRAIIGKGQQFLQSNSNKLANNHSSYKIVLQKISDNSSKKSSSQACSRKIIKTKYRLKSNLEESISKNGKSKLVNKSKYCIDKNSRTNNDVFSGKRNDLRTNEQTDSVPAAVLQQNDNNDEVDFHSCVSGFLQQLATCSQQDEVPVQDSRKNLGKNLQKLLVNADSCSSQISKFNHCNSIKNGVSFEKDLLECNQEQDIPDRQGKNIHLTPEVTNSFLDKTSHSDLHPTSHYAKDDHASCRVLARDNSNYSFCRLKECSVLLERISLPNQLLYNANASTFLVSENNTIKPLKATLTSNAEENEQNRSSSSTLLYIKQEPCDSSTFDRVDSIIEIEGTANSCFSSLSVPNYTHDLESSNYVPCQDAILIQGNDNAVITNVISCNEIGREDFSNRLCEVKEEPHLEDYERKITNNSSVVNKCILKQSEVLNGNQKLPECVNISEKCVEEYTNFQNKNLLDSAPNKFAGQIPKISSVVENNFNCSEISKYSHLKNTNSSNIGSRGNNISFEDDEEVQNNLQNPHYIDSSKSNNNDSESHTNKMKSSITFQAVNPLVCSISTNSAGKLKKGNTKLTSIDKIAEFCALRKSASQIPAHQLKISLLKKQNSPVINSENSKQKHLGSVPSVSIEATVDCCVKPDFNEKSTENKKGNGTVEHLRHKSTICGEVSVLSSETGSNKDVNFPSIGLCIRKEQNGQAALTLEKTRDEDRKESTFTSGVGEPGISSDENERSINPSNPAEVEVHVDKCVPVQLNQSECERNNSSCVLNRTDTYVVKSIAVKPQYIVNKNIPKPEKRIYPKLYKKYPLSEKKLIAFINCMKYTKNVKHTTMQMLAKNNTPGALKDLIVQLYEFFQACHDNNKKLQISRLIMLL
ncbi:hypothetical protein AVEN_102393-1, partial [Araneus ventricosus]